MLAQRQGENSFGNMFVETKVLIIEFLGAFALTYVGSWAIIFNDIGTLSANGVSLAHALVILVFMWFAIPISGAHFNPAITLGMIIAKRIDWTSAIFYIFAQFVGAIVGAGFIFIQLNPTLSNAIKEDSVLGIPRPGSKEYDVSGFWGEAIGSFVIMYAYMSLVADSRKHQTEGIAAAGFAFAVYVCSMTLSELSGAGLNPARSLAPAIVSGQFTKMQFIHFFGPIIGCLLSTIIYNSVYVDDDEDEKDLALKKVANPENQQILPLNENTGANEYELKENR